MAEQIPYGVAASIINKLASFAFREIGRVYGVADELEKLKSTLESIKVVLSDAEQKQAEGPVIKHWVCRFKHVLHDADDLMDDLAINDLKCKVEGRSKVHAFFSYENWFVKRAKLARKIEEIRKKFNDVAGDMAKLNLNSSSVVLRQDEMVWREAGSFVIESEVIGREDDKNKIIELLMQTHENKNVSLVAIVGIGGLGKTTLAQFVYNDAEVKRVFQKFIWVCVSEDFEAKTIMNKMLKSMKKGEVGDLEVDILQQKLREELNGQRYLLVLDDVWNENKFKWEALRTPLMCGGKGSMILVTTRSRIVAETMGISNPYVLKGLSEEQSWALLKKVTFGEHVSEMSPDLVSIGEKVAKKCRGVPLAIKTLGGLLQSRHEESEWMSILNGDVWRLCDEKECIMPVLKLSYRNLPFQLRQCFAYCCLYPKGWEIERAELIQLWMAQGYLESSDETQSMEDVGNDYVKILLMRSFFQEPFVLFGDIIAFKMHDLMHDLATSVAGNDCYLDCEGKGNIGRAMHISFLSSTSVNSLDSLSGSKPRTIFGLKIKDEFLAIPSTILNLKLLRSLDLSDSSITKLPEFIGKFKHLRHLDLSGCVALISLPKSIENLVMLQTLKLIGCRKLVFSLKVITKLISLRYLYIDCCKAFKEMMPAGLGKLTSLQILSDFVVADNAKSKRAKLNELRELNLRQNLKIRNLGLVEDVLSESREANLKGKQHVQSLTLMWGQDFYDGCQECKNSDSLQLLDNLCPHASLRELKVDGYPGVRFSSWLSSLTNIVHITLYGFSNCQHFPPLERLPSLESLQICEMKELKCLNYEEISHVFFPTLKTLYIMFCKNLRGWQRLGDDNDSNGMRNNLSLPPFPALSLLRIHGCPDLTCMPTFPHLIERLTLRNCSMKPMIETCLVQLEDASFCPLSSLEFLEIGQVTETETTAKEWMQNLTSLKRLHLGDSTLLHHLQYIPSEFQELSIFFAFVERFDIWNNEGDNGTQCHAPPHVLCSLQTLSFEFCENMKALPEQIGDLKSLRHIELAYCRKLESLPDAISCLTNLQTLSIKACDLLRDRCKAETGQDWPKIAHIPNKNIY